MTQCMTLKVVLLKAELEEAVQKLHLPVLDSLVPQPKQV